MSMYDLITGVRNKSHSEEAYKHAFSIPNKLHMIELFKRNHSKINSHLH